MAGRHALESKDSESSDSESSFMAGRTGLEPATDGFGDRYATNCATALRQQLSLFAMRALAPAPTAILAELQPFGGLHLVLERVIVAPLALSARQHDHNAVFFLSHRTTTSIADMKETDTQSVPAINIPCVANTVHRVPGLFRGGKASKPLPAKRDAGKGQR